MKAQLGPAHPTKFSDPILAKIGDLLVDWGTPQRTLDPFAGIGRVHELGLPCSVGVELEPEWATMHPKNLVGNALHLPFPDNSFDGMVSSPTYANRMADSHNAQDGSRRYSYTHTLGRTLHPDNSGTLQWGDAYRQFHDRAWAEALRVMQPEALLILNVSNHIRKFEEQRVTEWHHNWFMDHGCTTLDIDVVDTSRMRNGANRDQRVRFEHIIVLRYVAPVYTPDDEESDIEYRC